MQIHLSNWYRPVKAVLIKEALGEFRTRYAISALTMFALVILASISMTTGGMGLSSILQAVFLWTVLFFSAMAGLARVFVQEQEAGTLFALQLYVGAQTVIFGKLLFNMLLLWLLLIILTPVFVIFFNVEVRNWSDLITILLLGATGMAAVSTLMAALVAQTQGKGSLFAVLTFPILLPQFLAAIQATEKIFAGAEVGWEQLVFFAGYDVTALIAVSILFDYLWLE